MGTTIARTGRRARRRDAARAAGRGPCSRAAAPPGSSRPRTSTRPWTTPRCEAAGSRLGTGTLIVLDDQTCPVGMLRNLEQFYAQESCGWCTPCWQGLHWVEELLAAIEEGRGTAEDLELLEWHVGPAQARATPSATWPPGAMEPLESGLELFQEDFLRHIDERRCPWMRGAAPPAGTRDARRPRLSSAMADHLRREPAVRGARRAEPAGRLSGPGLRPALLLLAPGHGLGGRVPAVRGQAVQGRERHRGQDRHGLPHARPTTASASPSTTPRPGRSARASSSG